MRMVVTVMVIQKTKKKSWKARMIHVSDGIVTIIAKR